MSHTIDCRVTSGSNVIGSHCNVTENGGIVNVYVPDYEAKRFRSYGRMRYEEKREVGGTTVYRGWHEGKMVTWNVTPEPCRSCK